MTSQHIKRRAFTLTEIAIVLGVVGVVLGGIWVAARGVNDNLKMKQGSELLLSIVQKIRSSYAGVGSFSSAVNTDITNLLKNKNVFPPDIINADGTLNNPWSTAAGNNQIRVYVGPNTQDRLTISFAFPDNQDARNICANFLVANLRSGAEQVYATTSAVANRAYRDTSNSAETPADTLRCAVLNTPAAGLGAHFVYSLK